jgi:hypothetical protein
MPFVVFDVEADPNALVARVSSVDLHALLCVSLIVVCHAKRTSSFREAYQHLIARALRNRQSRMP